MGNWLYAPVQNETIEKNADKLDGGLYNDKLDGLYVYHILILLELLNDNEIGGSHVLLNCEYNCIKCFMITIVTARICCILKLDYYKYFNVGL